MEHPHLATSLDVFQVLLGWDPSDFEKLSEAPGTWEDQRYINPDFPEFFGVPTSGTQGPPWMLWTPGRRLSACSPMTTCGNWSIDGPVRPMSSYSESGNTEGLGVFVLR